MNKEYIMRLVVGIVCIGIAFGVFGTYLSAVIFTIFGLALVGFGVFLVLDSASVLTRYKDND